MDTLAIGPDTVVTLSYVLFDEHGDAVDLATEAEPLTYVHGYAQIIPGLERGLTGLHAGDRRQIVVEHEEAFGEHEDSGVFEVDKTDFPEPNEIELGDEFVAQGPDGEPVAMRVIEILEDGFRVDTNHPLAGQTIRFEVHVSEVRAANEDEIAKAQAELEGVVDGEHAGCACGHEHADGHDGEHAERLVTLSKKS